MRQMQYNASDAVVAKFASGMMIMEIVAEGDISRRTAYRYKAFYNELMKKKNESGEF